MRLHEHLLLHSVSQIFILSPGSRNYGRSMIVAAEEMCDCEKINKNVIRLTLSCMCHLFSGVFHSRQERCNLTFKKSKEKAVVQMKSNGPHEKGDTSSQGS